MLVVCRWCAGGVPVVCTLNDLPHPPPWPLATQSHLSSTTGPYNGSREDLLAPQESHPHLGRCSSYSDCGNECEAREECGECVGVRRYTMSKQCRLERAARPGRRMRRVRTISPVHYAQTCRVRAASPYPPVGISVVVGQGPGRYCSPRHRLPVSSTNEGSRQVE